MPFPITSTLELLTVRRTDIMFPFFAHLPARLHRDASRGILHVNQDTTVSCLPYSFPGVPLTFVFSSKGSLFYSQGHIFMFGSTTLIFVLATAVIVVGPGLTLQAIPGVINYIDPSIAVGWSIHKIDVMTGVVASITRINVGLRFPVSSRAVITKALLSLAYYQ
jgi:hypothetical protein